MKNLVLFSPPSRVRDSMLQTVKQYKTFTSKGLGDHLAPNNPYKLHMPLLTDATVKETLHQVVNQGV